MHGYLHGIHTQHEVSVICLTLLFYGGTVVVCAAEKYSLKSIVSAECACFVSEEPLPGVNLVVIFAFKEEVGKILSCLRISKHRSWH